MNATNGTTRNIAIAVAASTAIVVSAVICLFSNYQKKNEKKEEKEVSIARRLRDEIWKGLPKRIIFLRHGESEGNVNHSVYLNKSDCQLELTKKGKDQAHAAGKMLKRLLGNENVVAYVSPFERAKETLLCVKNGMIEEGGSHNVCAIHMDPRIREAERNNLQTPESKEDKKLFKEKLKKYIEEKKNWNPNGTKAHPKYPMHKEGTIEYHTDMAERLGRFFYRRPNGESCADVYDRCGDFLDALLENGADHSLHSKFRTNDRAAWRESGDYNTLIVTHGLTMRLMLMRYFQMSVSTYETMWNCRNCNFWVLKKDNVSQCYKLCGEESNPPRFPWATREVTVISKGLLPHHKERRRKCTIVDYLAIKQPRTRHVKDALERTVPGHNIYHIGRKNVVVKSDGCRVLREDGEDDIEFVKWEDDMTHEIDWYASSRDQTYPPCNMLSQEARDLRRNSKFFGGVDHGSTPIVMGVPTPRRVRLETEGSTDCGDNGLPPPILVQLRSVQVGDTSSKSKR